MKLSITQHCTNIISHNTRVKNLFNYVSHIFDALGFPHPKQYPTTGISKYHGVCYICLMKVHLIESLMVKLYFLQLYFILSPVVNNSYCNGYIYIYIYIYI